MNTYIYEVALEKLAASDPYRPSILAHMADGAVSGHSVGVLGGATLGGLGTYHTAKGLSKKGRRDYAARVALMSGAIGGLYGVPVGAVAGGIKGYKRRRAYDRAQDQD